MKWIDKAFYIGIGVLLTLLLAAGGKFVAFSSATAATPPVQETTPWAVIYSNYGEAIYRFTDMRAGVVCWLWTGNQKGGLSCLPLSQTNWDAK